MFMDQRLPPITPTLEPIQKTRLFMSCLDLEALQPLLQPTFRSSPSLPPHRTPPSFPPTPTHTDRVLQGCYVQFQSSEGFSSAGKIQFPYQWVLTGSHLAALEGLPRKQGWFTSFWKQRTEAQSSGVEASPRVKEPLMGKTDTQRRDLFWDALLPSSDLFSAYWQLCVSDSL